MTTGRINQVTLHFFNWKHKSNDSEPTNRVSLLAHNHTSGFLLQHDQNQHSTQSVDPSSSDQSPTKIHFNVETEPINWSNLLLRRFEHSFINWLYPFLINLRQSIFGLSPWFPVVLFNSSLGLDQSSSPQTNLHSREIDTKTFKFRSWTNNHQSRTWAVDVGYLTQPLQPTIRWSIGTTVQTDPLLASTFQSMFAHRVPP